MLVGSCSPLWCSVKSTWSVCYACSSSKDIMGYHIAGKFGSDFKIWRFGGSCYNLQIKICQYFPIACKLVCTVIREIFVLKKISYARLCMKIECAKKFSEV